LWQSRHPFDSALRRLGTGDGTGAGGAFGAGGESRQRDGGHGRDRDEENRTHGVLFPFQVASARDAGQPAAVRQDILDRPRGAELRPAPSALWTAPGLPCGSFHQDGLRDLVACAEGDHHGEEPALVPRGLPVSRGTGPRCRRSPRRCVDCPCSSSSPRATRRIADADGDFLVAQELTGGAIGGREL